MLKYRAFQFGIFASLLILASCNGGGSDDEASCAICNVTEKTSIQISGNLDIVDFTESLQNDASNDIIDYIFYGNPSQDFDFLIRLQSGWKLLIQLHDGNVSNPWEQIDQSFDAFPGKDLNEIARYVKVSLEKGGEIPGYTTNPPSEMPPQTLFGVFKITSLTTTEISGKIRDLTLYKTSNPASTITVNGTFTGAVTYQ